MNTDYPRSYRHPGGAVCKTIDIDTKARTVVAVISTEAVDRDMEVVVTRGLSLKHFRKNPVVLFMHDPTAVIGKSVWQKIRHRDGRDEMLAKTVFAETPLAEEAFELIKGEFLRGFSIGMTPMGMRRRQVTADDIGKRRTLKDADSIIEQAELAEYSVVSVPANQEALVSAAEKGLLCHAEPWLSHVLRAHKAASKPIVRRVIQTRKVARMSREPRIERVSRPMTQDQADTLAAQAVAFNSGRI